MILNSSVSEYQWTFSKENVSKKITCYDENGKPFSAVATAIGFYDDEKIYIQEDAMQSASSESGKISCNANFLKGEYEYHLNNDGTMTMHYNGVVWNFNQAK